MAMRLKLLLPKVEPGVFAEPCVCPNQECGGQQFHLHQEVRKAVRDTVWHEVTARRYECLRCGQTFRVYPLGITADQTSLRLKGPRVQPSSSAICGALLVAYSAASQSRTASRASGEGGEDAVVA